MIYNYSKLLGRITEKLSTRACFSEKMGLSERTISLKLNGKIGWKQEEIIKACEILSIDAQDIPEYFFTLLVQ